MNKVCEICGKEYETSRSHSRYCSNPACRKAGSRKGKTVTFAPESVTSKSKTVTSIPENVTQSKNVTENPVSVPGRDDIWSEQYETSEAGFRRRNKAWDSFQPQFRRDTVAACKRINADYVAIRAAAMAQRDYEAVSAVRGLVEG
jgi:hypothetical protein